MISPIVTWDALTISKYLPHVEPKFLLLLLLLDVGSYFPRLFFDVFCPFYNVSLVNGSSILQTKETKQPKSSKSQETRNRKSHISQEGTNYKRPRTQKPRRQSCKSQKKNTSQQPQTSEQRKCPLMIFHDITLFLYPFDDHLIPLSKFDDPMISQCSQLHFHHLSQFHRQLRLGAEGAELQFCLETREPPFHQPRNVR